MSRLRRVGIITVLIAAVGLSMTSLAGSAVAQPPDPIQCGWDNTPVPPTISVGDTGYTVNEAQCLLTDWGYDPGGIDGVFGSATEAAVIAFQTDKNLTVDGIVGRATWECLRLCIR